MFYLETETTVAVNYPKQNIEISTETIQSPLIHSTRLNSIL